MCDVVLLQSVAACEVEEEARLKEKAENERAVLPDLYALKNRPKLTEVRYVQYSMYMWHTVLYHTLINCIVCYLYACYMYILYFNRICMWFIVLHNCLPPSL